MGSLQYRLAVDTDVRIGVQAAPDDALGWRTLAQEVERLGLSSLLVADHPGSGPAPFVALGAAAAETERIALGSYVVNAGVWDPLSLASSVATLDLVSGGRALLGIGAGHTPAEWTMRGLPYPTSSARVQRMVELVGVTQRLLQGETVTFDGEHITAVDAVLDEPRPVQRRIPLVVGGYGRRVLAYAAEHADVVALSGLGRTLDDGHRHEALWSDADIDMRLDAVASAAAGRAPEVEALVQVVELTDDAEAAAVRLASKVPNLMPDQVISAPFAWVGTAEEIASQLRDHNRRWGIARYVVRSSATEGAGRIIKALAS